MPEAPGLGLDAAGELDLGEPFFEEARDEPADLVGHGGRGADALDLPGGLDRALADDGPADVLERHAREQLLEAAEVRDGQHVELEADRRRQAAVALGDEARQVLGRRQVDDRAERRLEAGALGHLAHEQRRLALGRHVQVRLLDRAGEVEEVGVLLQEGGVEAEGREAGLQAGDAAGQLRRRRQRGAGLHQLRSLPVRHAAVSP